MQLHETRATCEIYSVAHKNSFRWKWRHAIKGGATLECAEEYELFFDCVQAARAQGYEPRSQWTGPCALIERGRS